MEKKEYLVEITNKLKRLVNKDKSFTNLYDALFNEKINLYKRFDYEDSYNRGLKIKEVLDKITSIVYRPHIKQESREIILRSELSPSLSTESFLKTMKDVKNWKYKGKDISPEYVHSLESYDSLITYENTFIALLVNEISAEIKDILSSLAPITLSIEEEFEVTGLTYGEFSLVNQFESRDDLDLFSKESSYKVRVYKLFKILEHKVKLIKNSELYKLNVTKIKKDRTIIPTNILLHDILYSYCYKFYKENYAFESEDKSLLNSYYYNYVFVSLIEYLAKNKIGKTSFSNKANIYFDEANRIHFSTLAFKKDMFSFLIKEDDNNFGFYIETRLIDKAIRVNTNVDNSRRSLNYLLTSLEYSLENEANINLIMSSKKGISKTLFTMNNSSGNYSNVLNLSLYKKNHDLLFKNYVNSLMLLVNADKELFISKCPVCGKSEITFDGFNYHCENCHATYSFNNTSENDYMWIKSFRRVR